MFFAHKTRLVVACVSTEYCCRIVGRDEVVTDRLCSEISLSPLSFPSCQSSSSSAVVRWSDSNFNDGDDGDGGKTRSNGWGLLRYLDAVARPKGWGSNTTGPRKLSASDHRVRFVELARLAKWKLMSFGNDNMQKNPGEMDVTPVNEIGSLLVIYAVGI